MKRSMYGFIAMMAVLVFASFIQVAQAKEFKLLNDSSVPAARGKVDVDKDRNGNQKIKVEVEHLARPTALTPPKQAYVVWVQKRDGQPQPVGRLKVTDDLKGSLESTVPAIADEFDIFITAEDNLNAETPSEPRLLHGSIVT
jgi:hypothetical protein